MALMKRGIWIACCWLLWIAAGAQDNGGELNAAGDAAAQAETMKRLMADKPDSPVITLRAYSADSFRQLANDKGYAWMQYADSFYRNRYKDEPQLQRPEKNRSFQIGTIFRMLLWTAAIVGLLWLVWRIVGGNAGWWSRRNVKVDMPAEATEAETPQQLQQQLNQAVAHQQYRQAVRLRFIMMLQRMSQKGMLALHPSKTNSQYLQEIGHPDIRNSLAAIMLQYEYVWYGEFNPDEAQYQNIQSQYQQFEQRWL